MAIQSGFEKNPQMIMWDPETYPDVTGIADLGTEGVKVRYFGGAAYMDFFTGTGILSADQVDGSYNGDPSLFIADEGAAAQQGFGSAEPYLYENELTDWGKPVKYEYINDAGWENYAESIATKPENIEALSACFTKLVPIIQQASIDYVNEPGRANGVILAAVDAFGEDFGWTYSEGAAAFGVATMLEDGLIANGPDGIMGNFDLDRVERAHRARGADLHRPGRHAARRRHRRRHRHEPVHRRQHRSLTGTEHLTPEHRDRAGASAEGAPLIASLAELVQDHLEQHVGAGLDVVGFGELGDVVAEPVDARREHHGRRAEPRQHLGVVAGTARHPPRRATEPMRRLLDEVDHRRVEEHRFEAGQRRPLDRHALRARRSRRRTRAAVARPRRAPTRRCCAGRR